MPFRAVKATKAKVPGKTPTRQVENEVMDGESLEFHNPLIDSADAAGSPAERTFVSQERLVVIRNLPRRQGQARLVHRLTGKLPRKEDVTAFKHQIPMLARERLVV